MCTGAEAAPAVAEGAKAAGSLEAAAAAEAGLALGSGSATAATLGGASGLAGATGAAGALEGGTGLLNASYAQPTAAVEAGLLPQASFTQGSIASKSVPSFLSGAAGGTAAGAALDAGSYGYGGPAPTTWDTVKQVGQQANNLWNDIGPLGQTIAKQVGSAAMQGVMGDGGDFKKQLSSMLNQSYGARQAVPLQPTGLMGSTGVAQNPDGVVASMSRPAPVAPSSSSIGTQAAPSMPGSNSGNGAVKLGGARRQQYA